MKKAFLLLLALAIAAVVVLVCVQKSRSGKAAALSPASSIVRIYFAGAANLAADPYSTAFTNIFCSSQARALQIQTLDKLSRAPGVWFKNKLPAGVGDGSALLRPLLDDLIRSEWVFEMRDAPSSPEYALAIQLNDTRAQLWQSNLQTLLESWTQIKVSPISRDVTKGWELKKDMPPNLFRVVRTTGNWLVIGCGQDELPLSDAWASGAELPDTNETNWVSAKVNWPRLAQIFPIFAKSDLPPMQMQIVGRGGELLPSGTFELSQSLPALDPWQIPTNLIHQPLTSFTAVRGFAPWLERQPWSKWLQISPKPNQAFAWSLAQFPLQIFLAVPVTNGVTALAQLDQNLAVDTNWESHFIIPLALARTNNRIELRNVPLVTPEVQALKESAGDFLFADTFPNSLYGRAPSALLQEVSRDNLLFYHWEITSDRLKELPELVQLTLLLTKHRQLESASAAGQWLNQIGPTLGNCVTEVVQTGPGELTFKRSAPAGLTAVELMAIAEWLEAPNFPGFDMSPPPRHLLPNHHLQMQHLQNTNQPAVTNHPPLATNHPPVNAQPPQPLKTRN